MPDQTDQALNEQVAGLKRWRYHADRFYPWDDEHGQHRKATPPWSTSIEAALRDLWPDFNEYALDIVVMSGCGPGQYLRHEGEDAGILVLQVPDKNPSHAARLLTEAWVEMRNADTAPTKTYAKDVDGHD